MATTKFYLDMRGKAKDGRGSVVIILAHNQTTTSFSTGVRLLPSQWNGTSAIKIEGREAINASLVQKKQQIDKELAIIALEERFHSMTASQLKAAIDNPKKRYRHDSCGRRIALLYRGIIGYSMGVQTVGKAFFNSGREINT